MSNTMKTVEWYVSEGSGEDSIKNATEKYNKEVKK